jgi:DNA-binding MarR family transcriptional regulator
MAMTMNDRGNDTTALADGGSVADEARRLFRTVAAFRRWTVAAFPETSEGYDISQQQLNVLYFIRTQSDSMAEIARLLYIAPTVVTGLVDRLEARGMLTRQPDPEDRRRLRLVLTDKGRAASVDIENRFAALVEQAIASRPPADQTVLSRGLDILYDVVAGLERDATMQGT